MTRVLRPRTLALSWVLVATSLLVPEGWAKKGEGRSYPLVDHSRLQRQGQRTFDLDRGVLVSAFEIEAGPYTGSLETQARAYLSVVAAEYGLRPAGDDLVVTKTQSGPGSDVVRFQQTVAGIPVLETGIAVTIRRSDGRIASVMSRYFPGAQAQATSAARTPQDAIATAVAHLSATPERIGPESAELVLYPEGNAFPLVHRVLLPAAQPLGDWEVLVDATGGEVLRVRDRAVYADGSGLVFDPDPLTTAEVNYGTSGYVDGNDATTPEMDAEHFTRNLLDITFSGGLYRLQGPYCTILDFESPASPPATSATPGGFQFDRSEQGFEDVNVYWGIDTSQRYIQSLGFNSIQNNSIQCDPHGVNGDDNSHFIPSSNRLAWGEGGVDDAEDQDVIWHEYGHAIQFGTVPEWGFGEADAMGEGFGDYWAGSYSASVSAYRDNWVFNWDGHNPFWNGRVLDYTAHYPDGLTGFIHTDGQMWSSNLMLVWHETCREIVDRNTLDHHSALTTAATMIQAAEAWVQSDQILHDGLNVDSFVFHATARGFFLPTDYDIPATTHTPLSNTTVAGPYPVTLTVTSGAPISSVDLWYGTGGVIASSVGMNPTGNPDEWTGDLPHQGDNVTISYYVVAENDSGYKATEPRPAPCGSVHTFEVMVPSSVEEVAMAGRNVLEAARPNPFAPSTTITYSLARSGRVQLAVYDVRGKRVRMLVDESAGPERFIVPWDGRSDDGKRLASGVYEYRLQAPGFERSRKMILLR